MSTDDSERRTSVAKKRVKNCMLIKPATSIKIARRDDVSSDVKVRFVITKPVAVYATY